MEELSIEVASYQNDFYLTDALYIFPITVKCSRLLLLELDMKKGLLAPIAYSRL